MNKLFLIGNGFDRAHNKETSYEQFILWYLNKYCSNTNVSGIKVNNPLMSVDIRYGYGMKFETVNDFLEETRQKRVNYNPKNEFVNKIIRNTALFKWVDIESEYFVELVSLYKELEKIGSSKESVNEKIMELNESFSFLKEKLIEYLGGIEEKEKNHNIEYHIDKEIGEVINGFNGGKSTAMVLNFNYTNTIDMYFNSKYSDYVSINNIHGNLGNTDSIVFGYGDEMDVNYEKMEQLNENEYLKNMKSFYYLKSNNYRGLIRFVGSGKYDIIVMGHSCGVSDRVLLNYIFEHENCENIKIYYHQKNAKENDFFEKTQEISRHFRPELKNKMRAKIVPFNECLPLVEYKDVSEEKMNVEKTLASQS